MKQADKTLFFLLLQQLVAVGAVLTAGKLTALTVVAVVV
jgi:hypothetical protein